MDIKWLNQIVTEARRLWYNGDKHNWRYKNVCQQFKDSVMNKSFVKYFKWIIVLGFLNSSLINGQDINIKLAFRDSIKSKILNEDRKILIHLPDDYYTSNKSYPVIYRLDGDTELIMETIPVINRLYRFDELIPDMIIVAIENIDRAKDMLPVKTKFYSGIPGANNFLDFIETELIPYIDNNYHSTNNRILCGKSLSGLFTIYALLAKPNLFDSYIACSAGFPDCEIFFKEFADSAFQSGQYKGQKIFIANGLKDPYDPDGSINQQMIEFSDKIRAKLENKVDYKYVTYDNYGHVPYSSFYDGLKFVFESGMKK